MYFCWFFYPRLLSGLFTGQEVLMAVIALAFLVWVAIWGQFKMSGRWGTRFVRWAALAWILGTFVLIVWRLGSKSTFPGYFVKGLRGEPGYLTTTTATPSVKLRETRAGFRINVIHVTKVTMKKGKPGGAYADYVEHVWISLPDYLRLSAELRKEKIPFPAPDNMSSPMLR